VKEVVRPDSLTDFVDLVVPELRERGLVPDPDDAGDSPRGDGTSESDFSGQVSLNSATTTQRSSD